MNTSFQFNIYLLVNRDMGYDGIVLESWSRWAAYGILHDPDMRNMVSSFSDEFMVALFCYWVSLKVGNL